MKIKRNNKPVPPPAIRTAIEQGIYREIPRHELHPGSWQQEMYDKQGRRFYESTAKPEPFGRPLDVHQAAAEAEDSGSTVMVFIQASNTSIPYDKYVEFLEAGGHPASNIEPLEKITQQEEVAEIAGPIATSESAEIHQIRAA